MSDTLLPPQGTPATPDMGNAYAGERAQAVARDSDPDAWFDSLSNGSTDTTQSGGAPKPAADNPGDAPKEDLGPIAREPLVAWTLATLPAIARLWGVQDRANDMAGRAAGDIGKGVIEAPGAIARGTAAAVSETAQTVNAFAGWLESKVPLGKIGSGDDDPLSFLSRNAETVKSAFSERDSNTGKAVEVAAQWLTSQALAGKITKAFGLKPSAYKRIVDSFIGGAAGFDPGQERLSNMIDKAAPNPLTDWLKSDGEDPELLARFKSGLETAGLQAASEGVILAFKALKVAKTAKPVPAAQQADDAGQMAAKPTETAPAIVANDNAKFSNQARQYLAGEIPDSPVKVNLDRFDGPDQIRAEIGKLSQLLPEEKVIPMKATLEQAKALGIGPEEFAAGVEGKLFDRRQIAAGWMSFRSASQELVSLAQKARATGSAEDIARFNAGFQTTFGILQTVKGQSAEIARALQIHNALRKADQGMVKALTQLVDDAGGAAMSLDMAEKVSMLQSPEAVAAFVREAGNATTRDQIVYIWSNILLSNPTTHIINVADTTAATFAQVPETWFASKIGSDVAKGEATARLFGIVQGMKDGVRLAAKAWQTGQSQFQIGSRVETMANRPLPTANDLSRSGVVGQASDYLKMLMPTRILQAGDELTKVMNYRAEMHALAWRKAVSEQGLSGKEAQAFAAKLINEAPEWLTKQAEAMAIKGTFNEPLQGAAASIARVVDQANVSGVPVGRVIMPFVRTPANLLRWTLHRTPAAFLSPAIRAEIAAGGASRDLALGRIAAGSTVLASFADLTASGTITGAGPKDPGLRAALMRTGWQPYSIKVGDTWYTYGRSGTIGSLVGLAADAVELISGIYANERETIRFDGEPVEESTAAAVTFPFAQAILSKTYMSGLASIIEALSDPQRYGEGYINRLLSSIVPSGVGAIERAVDPEIRRAKDWMDAIKARIPGFSGQLPERLSLWGDPIKDENGIYNLFLPVRRSAEKGTAIDAEIVRLGLDVGPPKQTQSFGRGGVSLNIELSPEQHNRLIRLAGNELKVSVPGMGRPMGARDYLNAIVEGKAGETSRRFESGSDDLRELIIRDVMTKFRTAAKNELLKTDPDLRQLVEGRLSTKAQEIRAPRIQ